MNKQAKRKFLIALGTVGVIAAAGLIYTAFVVFSLFSHGNALGKVSAGYKKIVIPSTMHLESKTQTGDPIDSPQLLGWQYTYTTSVSEPTVFRQLEDSVKSAGYKITGDNIQSTPVVTDKDGYQTGGSPFIHAENATTNILFQAYFENSQVIVTAELLNSD